MMKKFALVFLGLGLLVPSNASASEYGLCINKSRGDWRVQVTCNQDETRRLLREINNTYAKLARNPQFAKLNNGENAITKQFKDWKAYRDSYCAYYEASKSGHGDEEYQKTDCLRIMTRAHLDDLEALIANSLADMD